MDAGRCELGTFPTAAAESAVVIVYGDNRPGMHVETWSWGYQSVRRLAIARPSTWVPGLVALPVFLVRAVLPPFDGPQDLVTVFTKRPYAGAEKPVLAAATRALPADAVISTGDVVTDGRRGRHYEDFVARHDSLRRAVPYLASPGNHERTWAEQGQANWDAAIGRPARPARNWFAADVGDGLARFVFLDSNVLTDARRNYPDSLEESLSREQLAWADSALASPARYRFLVFHHPIFSSGHYRRDWGTDAGREPAWQRRRELLEICRRRNVTAVLTGHEHLYQRLFVRTEGGGFWHVTTGGAGSPLYPIVAGNRDQELARPQPEGMTVERSSVFGKKAYHYCRLVLPRSDAAPPRLESWSVRGSRTELLDRFELTAPEGG
jgi:hypothetical protein